MVSKNIPNFLCEGIITESTFDVNNRRKNLNNFNAFQRQLPDIFRNYFTLPLYESGTTYFFFPLL